MPRTGDEEKQLDVSYIASCNAKWYGHARKFGNFYQVKLILTTWLSSLYPKYHSREIKTLDHTKTCAWIFIEAIHNCQKCGNNPNVLEWVTGEIICVINIQWSPSPSKKKWTIDQKHYA